MGMNNSLLKSMQTIVDKAVDVAPFDKTRQCIVIANNHDNTYAINLDGVKYGNVMSYPNSKDIEVGSVVKVVIPTNNANQMYIQSPKGGSGGGGGEHVELTQAEYDALTPEEKMNGTVYFVTDGDPEYLIINDSVPIGAIQPFGGATTPDNWLLCDGSAVSRTDYAELFDVIGTTYGSGDGSTTFNLPDLKGRVAMGVGESTATGHTAHTLGQKDGEETHILTVNEMPSHAHDAIYINYWGQQVSGASGSTTGWSGISPNSGSSTTNAYTSSKGGGQPHNNLQPYLVTNYIIKAKEPQMSNIIHNIDAEGILLGAFYPVGSYYETSNANFNPNTEWGGTWVKEEGDTAEERKLLWTNSAVTSFSAQTITLSDNLHNYDAYEVDYNGWVSAHRMTMKVCDVRQPTEIGVFDSVTYRLITPSADGATISIGDGYSSGSIAGSSSIPRRIYGIKQFTQYKWHRTA